MSIHKIGSDLVRPSPVKAGGPHGRKADRDAAAAQGKPERTDQVGFSAEGLALAEKARLAAGELSGERLESLRQRIAGGFYDDPAVAEEVALRLLDSGDLGLGD